MREQRQMDVLVVDDEALARRGLRILLREELGVTRVREAASAPEAIAAIRDQRPDVVFLDIHLGASNGFSVAEAFTGRDMPLVIFVTAYDQYAVQAFEAHAIDYLLKPIDPARLRDAVERAARLLEHSSHAALRTALDAAREMVAGLQHHGTDAATMGARLAVRDGPRTVFLAPVEIAYAESAGNGVRIHANKTVYTMRITMDALAERLGDDFIRIRRSVVIRRAGVRMCEPLGRGAYAVVMDDGTKLVSSRFFREGIATLLASG